MASFNKVILVGRLTKDPEFRYTPTGSPVCEISLASNRTHGKGDDKKEEVLFINIVVWGSLAGLMGSTLAKGASILVEGRLQLQRWESDNGEKRSKIQVVAESIQYMDKKDYGGESS